MRLKGWSCKFCHQRNGFHENHLGILSKICYKNYAYGTCEPERLKPH